MKENWRIKTGDFHTAAERDAWIIANASTLTVVRYLGPHNGYERHEVRTLQQAEKLAGRLAKQAGKPYLIYALAGRSDCFVKAINP